MSYLSQTQQRLPRVYPISGTRFRLKHLRLCTVFSHKKFLAGGYVSSSRANWKESTTKPANSRQNLTLKAKNCSKKKPMDITADKTLQHM